MADAIDMDSLTLSEDDLYRQSSQYRLWSFSPGALAAARQETNNAAAKRVEAALGHPVETLTPGEELIVIRQALQRTTSLIKFLEIRSTNVTISAVQFLKRFYVGASCMEYTPNKMVVSAVFLAAKTHGITLELHKLAASSGVSEQAVTAPEFKLAQGCRFAFDVRTPMRGLEGAYVNFKELGNGPAQKEMEQAFGTSWENRLGDAFDKTKQVLKQAAILSDVYFLYTPPQIWLGALMTVDRELASFYLDFALAGLSNDEKESIKATLESCNETLAKDEEFAKLAHKDSSEAKRIQQKLKLCTNPETSDLIELNAAQKRDPDPNSVNGHASKKLKINDGKVEDPFGPSLTKPDPKAEPE